MQGLLDSLAAVQQRLASRGKASAAIGGLAIGVWGEPRLTKDIDVKVALDRSEADRLLEALGPGYPAMADDPREALRHNGIPVEMGVSAEVVLPAAAPEGAQLLSPCQP